jgi:hypothetical protein
MLNAHSVGALVTRLTAAALVALAVAALFGTAAPARAQDVTAPTLVSYSVSPSVVDVTAGDAALQITAEITDDLSGFATAGIVYVSPDFGWIFFADIDASHRTSGDALNGTYVTNIVVPEHSKAGTWTVMTFSAVDVAGNPNTASPSPASSNFDVVSIEDAGPPTLVAIGASPTNLDVTSGPGTFTLIIAASDDLSGFDQADVTFQSPSGTEEVFASLDASHRVSGGALNGVYQRSVSFPQLSEAGDWIVESVVLRDAYGYTADLPNASLPSPPTISVTFTPDSTPPTLLSISVTPTPVSILSGPRTVLYTAHITDDITGVDAAGALLGSPVEEESKVIVFDEAHRISGNNLNGVYQVPVEFAAGDTLGWWTIEVYANDAANNYFRLSGAGLPGPSGFLVTTAPPPPLPALGPLGLAGLAALLAGASTRVIRRN